jgi:CubicO group peptidase (beta-lactamase class C family)
MIQRREFIRQVGLSAAAFGIMSSFPETMYAFPAYAGSLPRSTPEQEGVSSAGVIAFLDAIEKSKIEFHSLMILRHGRVIAEGWWAPYSAPLKHTLYSLSKSFTSTAVGLAISEGKFKLDSKVTSFFPDELPAEVSAHLAAMTVKDLLTMSTGHAKDTIPPMRTNTTGESWAKIFLSLPVEHQPGTHFLYNTGATYMLSAIVQKTTGQNVLEYLKPRLFEPLGIDGMDWEMDPKGIAVGGYGLRIRTEDIAKFGQLFLQKGKWNNQQLISAEWIEMATSKQVENAPATPTAERPNTTNDWAQGYGFQFWRCTPGHGVRGDGAFGQFCMMLPEQDMVVAITEESFDLQKSMRLVWDHLLPAVKEGIAKDKQNLDALDKKMKSLALLPPSMKSTSTTASRISGRKFSLTENPLNARSISFAFSGDNCTVSIQDDASQQSFKCGLNKWTITKDFKTQQVFPMQGRPTLLTQLAAAATWRDENTLEVALRYIETAHGDNITFVFDGDNLAVKFLNSVAKGNPNAAEQRAPLTGKLSA